MKAANVALIVSGLSVIGIVTFVHHQQKSERMRMHQGVIRDEERRLRKAGALQQQQQQQPQPTTTAVVAPSVSSST